MATDPAPLTPNQKIRLLRIAREAVYYHVSRRRTPAISENDARLAEEQGLFVSLHIGDRLRGCIGRLHGEGPLYDAVAEMAVSAATRDPRFEPLRMDEVPRIDIELSILSPMAPIAPEDVVVGRHGLYVAKGRARGTLLPQVATQYGWDREEFLAQTCAKAGLPRDAWKDPECEILAFEAEVFSESELRDQRS